MCAAWTEEGLVVAKLNTSQMATLRAVAACPAGRCAYPGLRFPSLEALERRGMGHGQPRAWLHGDAAHVH